MKTVGRSFSNFHNNLSRLARFAHEVPMRDAVQEFMAYNRPFARRNPELLRFKIARMAESPFAFFRGTFHLFAGDVVSGARDVLPLFANAGAELDLVGDLHSENFGTYKANDGLIHYD